MIERAQLSLGILAGGRAERLGGVDKAWEQFQDSPLVERVIEALRQEVHEVIVSTPREDARYEQHCVRLIADRVPGQPGPLAGLDALLSACETPWLLSVPVDLRSIPDTLIGRLGEAAETGTGAVAEDADGLQPLVAMYHVGATREAVASALAARDFAVHRLVFRLGLAVVSMPDVRFGNLNTPDDFVDSHGP